jgi:hypothetical protein
MKATKRRYFGGVREAMLDDERQRDIQRRLRHRRRRRCCRRRLLLVARFEHRDRHLHERAQRCMRRLIRSLVSNIFVIVNCSRVQFDQLKL